MTKLASGLGFTLEDAGIEGYDYSVSEGTLQDNSNSSNSSNVQVPDLYEDEYVDGQIDDTLYSPSTRAPRQQEAE